MAIHRRPNARWALVALIMLFLLILTLYRTTFSTTEVLQSEMHIAAGSAAKANDAIVKGKLAAQQNVPMRVDIKAGKAPEAKPEASQNQKKVLNFYFKACKYEVIFTQNEINNICAPSPPIPSVCHVVSINHLDQRDFRPAQLQLPSGQPLPMFVHPSTDGISNAIVSTGGWDPEGVNSIVRALVAVPGAALVDIGCNLGVFSLRAASLGRKVVSIDANYQNAIRLRRSVVSNGMENRVQVFWNALATEPGTLRMRLPSDCNIGGGIPTETQQLQWLADPVSVRTAGLDHLLLGNGLLADTSDLVIKIDIEGSEWDAIATAVGTFSRYRVPIVLMEWRGTQIFHPEKADFLLRFFASRKYKAFDFKDRRPVALDNGQQKNWPRDVWWANVQGQEFIGLLGH